MEEEPVGRLARVGTDCKVHPQGTHQVASALPVVLYKRLHQDAEWLQGTAARQLPQESIRFHRLPFQMSGDRTSHAESTRSLPLVLKSSQDKKKTEIRGSKDGDFAI